MLSRLGFGKTSTVSLSQPTYNKPSEEPTKDQPMEMALNSDLKRGQLPLTMKNNESSMPDSEIIRAQPNSSEQNLNTPKISATADHSSLQERKSRSEENRRSNEKKAEHEDRISELPAQQSLAVLKSKAKYVRDSAVPPRPRLSTMENPFTFPGLPNQNDNRRKSFDNILLSSRQENFDRPHCGDSRRPSEASLHIDTRTNINCESSPLNSPYGRHFIEYKHTPTPEKDTLSGPSIPPLKIPAPAPVDQPISPLSEEDHKHTNGEANLYRPFSEDSMRKDLHNPDYGFQTTHGIYVPPACTERELHYPKPSYTGNSQDVTKDREMQRESNPHHRRRQDLRSWRFWKTGWWTVERTLLILAVMMSFLIFVVLLGKR